jgi:hypothetical protein
VLPFQDQIPSSSRSLVENNPATEPRERGTQALPEEIQTRLKEKNARDQIRDLDYFEGMLGPISQELPEDIKTSLDPIKLGPSANRLQRKPKTKPD